MGFSDQPPVTSITYLQDDQTQNGSSTTTRNRSKSPPPNTSKTSQSPSIKDDHKWQLNWVMVLTMAAIHLEAMLGFFLAVTEAKVATLAWYFILIQFGATGIICGAHRLWTHRAYKAGVVFRVFLMLCNTLALQESIYTWCQWHRVHHKWSDTDADPHNAGRGFFFSHIGWIMVKRHPQYLAKSKAIDMSDLQADRVVQFQHRFYIPLVLLVWFFMPVTVPWYFWSENIIIAVSVNFFRYVLSLHQTSLVNSAAHLFGQKIYDTRIMSTKHYFTTCVTMGEAYHNYHHAFPWDYSASEFGWAVNYNPMTAVIDGAAWLGLAWNRKKASRRLVEERIRKYGDIERLPVERRVPRSVVLDTLQGAFWLFWALWVILVLKAIYLYCGFDWNLPIVHLVVQFFGKNDSPKLVWDTIREAFV